MPNLIGLSLPLDYLAANTRSSPAAILWQAALGDPIPALQALRQIGVGSVELRPVTADSDPALLLRAARRVWQADLALTLHGYLPQAPAELCPAFKLFARALAERGDESLLVVHSHSAASAAPEDLVASSVRDLRWLLTAIERDGFPLRVALENERWNPNRISPGQTYAGILAILAQVNSPRLGACWDFGHAYASVQQSKLEATPPSEFLRCVTHTHIHDLVQDQMNPSGMLSRFAAYEDDLRPYMPSDFALGPRTHFPLTCGIVPIRQYLGLLAGAGYMGIANLELNPERCPEAPFADALHASIWRLREAMRVLRIV